MLVSGQGHLKYKATKAQREKVTCSESHSSGRSRAHVLSSGALILPLNHMPALENLTQG